MTYSIPALIPSLRIPPRLGRWEDQILFIYGLNHASKRLGFSLFPDDYLNLVCTPSWSWVPPVACLPTTPTRANFPAFLLQTSRRAKCKRPSQCIWVLPSCWISVWLRESRDIGARRRRRFQVLSFGGFETTRRKLLQKKFQVSTEPTRIRISPFGFY